MAVLRVCLTLLLTLLLGSAGARAAEPQTDAPLGLFDRPVLVVDPGMHTAAITRASADKDGRWAVTGSDDKTIRIWSPADGALVRTIRLPAGPSNVGKVYAVAVSPDGALVASGGWTGPAGQPQAVYLFDRATGALVRRIEGGPHAVDHLAFSPDDARLAAVLGAGGLRVYTKQTGWAEEARDEDYGGQSYGVDFASDGRLATTSYDEDQGLHRRSSGHDPAWPCRSGMGWRPPLRDCVQPRRAAVGRRLQRLHPGRPAGRRHTRATAAAGSGRHRQR
jgi:hypothetical protein